MRSFKTSHVSMVLLSFALVHCGRDKSPEPAAAAPAPGPAIAETTPGPSQGEQMTPASGTGEQGAQKAPAAEPPAAAPPAPVPLTDQEIFKVIDLANTGEVDQAKLAQTKAKNTKVKNFAAKMISHHGKAKEKGSKLSTKLGVAPAESTASTQLKSDAEAMMLTLKSAPAGDFDETYINGQVQEHQKVLAALDEKLIPNAKDAELKALLQEMRATVESHLKEAAQIEAELGQR
jgi:putative membrane protein